MKISYFIEYIIIGTLYLIPYFVIHYTLVCFGNGKKMGFLESIKIAYQRAPEILKGKISIDIKNPNIPIFIFVFMLLIVGAISNGILLHMDNYWVKCLSKVYPNEYALAKDVDNYARPVEAMFKYDKSEIGELLGKIRFQKIITRHGLFHSIIIMLCIPFIFASKKLKISAKMIWLILCIIAFSQSAIGFLAISGWQQGVINAILSIKS